MTRNNPKNSVVPAIKYDMAKRLVSDKKFMKTATPRQPSISNGNMVLGYKHGEQSPSLTMKRDKHFTHGAMGAQGSNTKKESPVGGGWEMTSK